MADETIEIEIVLDDGKIKKGIAKIPKEAQVAAKKSGKALEDGLTNSVESAASRIGVILAGVAASVAGAFGSREAIAAASRQEKAVEGLNNSLRRIGQFSKESSQELQDFASALQQSTKFGDEAILEQLAFAQSLGASAAESQVIVAAATDLATAFDQDLNTATRNLTKTLSGLAGELGETVSQLRTLSVFQLRAGVGIELISKLYSGLARGAVKTFNGRITQLTNTFGDLLEAIGFLVTKNPEVLRGIKELNIVFAFLIDRISRSTDAISKFISEGILALGAGLKSVLVPISTFVNLLDNPANIALATVLVRGFGKALSFVGSLLRSFDFKSLTAQFVALNTVLGPIVGSIAFLGRRLQASLSTGNVKEDLRELGQRLRTLKEELNVSQEANAIERTWKQLRPPAAIQSEIDQVIMRIKQLDEATKKGLVTDDTKPTGFLAELTRDFAQFKTQFETDVADIDSILGKLEGAFKSRGQGITKEVKKIVDSANAALNQGLANVMASSIERVTQRLVEGKSVFQDFGAFILGLFGDVAVNLGRVIIASALAIDAFKASLFGSAGAAIAFGAGLIAIGTILKSLSRGKGALGGGAGGGVGDAGGGGVAGGGFDSGTTALEPDREPGAQVIFNIKGSVLSTKETADNIVDLVNDAFEQRGVRILQA